METEDQEVEVLNLATWEIRRYAGITPHEAVIAARAQEQMDWHTWDYETRYRTQVVMGLNSVRCGDWAALRHTK